MKVISTNIATPKTINWRGKQIQTGIYKKPSSDSIFIGIESVENDHVIDKKHHGGADKACYLFSEMHYAYWKKIYPKLDWDWGMFGENLTISDLDEAKIFVGDIYEIGETVVQITQPRQPCFKLGIRFGTQKMIKQYVSSGHSGSYVRVLKEGNVKTGDEFKLIERPNSELTILDIFRLLYSDKVENEKVKAALTVESLAESCKKDLRKKHSL